MSHSSIINNLYSSASYIVSSAWSYVPTKETMITVVAKVILNKYSQVTACVAGAAASSYKASKQYNLYVIVKTIPNLNKPKMKWVSKIDANGVETQKLVQETRFVPVYASPISGEQGETYMKEEFVYEMEYRGSKFGFIKENWKMPALATACVVAAIARILLP